MPAPHPDDHPATRRDLSQMREVVEANVRAGFAEMNAKMAERFGEVEARFGKVDSKIANQTRLLVALNVLLAAVIIRATG